MRFCWLSDRSWRPIRDANQLTPQVEAAIVAAKKEKPNWGARKIRERLLRKLPHETKVPAISTIHTVLDRYRMVSRGKRRKRKGQGTPLSDCAKLNDLWCTDYRREFQLGNRQYCYPLTVTDYASRYLLLSEAVESNREQNASRHSKDSFVNVAHQRQFALKMVFLSHLPTGYSIFRNYRCCGCARSSKSNESSQVIHLKMVDTQACI